MARLIDEALPRWDVTEVHATWMAASPGSAYAAARAVTVGEIRLLAPLMAVRLLPALLVRGELPRPGSGPVLDAMVARGFTMLGERPPHEVAVGAVGRFWQLAADDAIRPIEGPEAFARFADPGFARAATDFRVVPERGGSRVITETRIAGTDPEATRLFRRYWRVVGIGSALIRVSWLNAIRRRAER